MCGRYTLSRQDRIIEVVPNITVKVDIGKEIGRFNIAPTQDILAVTNREAPTLEKLHWGLIPSWAKDPSIGNRMINARAESLSEKPAFKKALEKRRCLVFADGFYEWRKEPDGKTKTPMYVRMKNRDVFAFAGLWEVWKTPDGQWLPSCTIVTTDANDLMRGIHDRMPVIVPPELYLEWLDPAPRQAGEMTGILRPYDAALMEAFPVSRAVNSPKNEGPELVRPAPAETPPQPVARGAKKKAEPGQSLWDRDSA